MVKIILKNQKTGQIEPEIKTPYLVICDIHGDIERLKELSNFIIDVNQI